MAPACTQHSPTRDTAASTASACTLAASPTKTSCRRSGVSAATCHSASVRAAGEQERTQAVVFGPAGCAQGCAAHHAGEEPAATAQTCACAPGSQTATVSDRTTSNCGRRSRAHISRTCCGRLCTCAGATRMDQVGMQACESDRPCLMQLANAHHTPWGGSRAWGSQRPARCQGPLA